MATALKTTRSPLLLAIVIIGGVSTMAIQMTASRLVQTYFGSSLVIWANLIGFTMVCLALGYYFGGRLSARFPRATFLYQLTLVAGLAMALIPLINNPVLDLTGPLRHEVRWPRSPYFDYDGHWTRDGHRTAARAIRDFLSGAHWLGVG